MPPLSLRGLHVLLALGIFVTAITRPTRAADVEPVQLHWLGDAAPASATGVSFGVPWPRGMVQKGDALSLKTSDGKAVAMQTWPLAYWPDGSLKWTGEAIVGDPQVAGPFQVSVGGASAPEKGISCTSTDDAIDINAGSLRCHILTHGSTIFDSLYVGSRKVAQDAKLVALTEDRSEFESQGILRQERFVSRIDKVTLEQSGPLRAVVKIEGMHKSEKGERAWLPFVVRLYFYANSSSIRIVHSFIFDGDASKDFIKGIGISVSVPFKEEQHNRHVRFAGDTGGMWVQPVRLVPGYRGALNATDYAAHLAGQRIVNLADMSASQQAAVQSVPVWNDFKLTQTGPDSFSIDKRTGPQGSWLHVDNGHRSQGLAVLGDVSGSIAMSNRRFWEKYPSEMEIKNAGSDVGEMIAWLWSPDAPAMDLRNYDNTGHGLTTNYEDWKPGWDTPTGIANTSDLTLWAFGAIPASAELVNMTKVAAEPPLLVCTPEYYHANQVFGIWSLPDVSSPAKQWIENQLNGLISFYQQQVEERHWFGFWNYGDVMHNYDFGRHVWRYDIGGWAWMNGELMPDTFLYYSFLRTGRADIFRMAEAMTRQNSEVDVYHIGQFAPLGSRHAVDHWGDGAKQPRISQAGLRRFYYYLTTDERVGDLMQEQLPADVTYNLIKRIDPGHQTPGRAPTPARNATTSRNAAPADPTAPEPPGGMSFGTDWSSFASNWMTEWERTGDTKYRDKIITGMKSMVAGSQPGQIGAGTYDPATGAFTRVGGRVGYFDMIFGAPELMFEMKPLFDDPAFWTGWVNACESMSNGPGNQMTAPRAAAYAAFVKKDRALGLLAWDKLIGNAMQTEAASPKLITSPDLLNPTHDPVFLGSAVGWQLHGPASVQWSLNAIETLELAKEYLPDWEKAHAPSK